MADLKKEVVRGIIFDYKGRVLILKRDDGNFCLPGGIVEENDLSLELALIRELDEEVRAEVKSVIFFDSFSINITGIDWENYFYLVVVTNPDSLQINDESQNLLWVDYDELKNYFFAYSNEVYIEKAFEARLKS